MLLSELNDLCGWTYELFEVDSMKTIDSGLGGTFEWGSTDTKISTLLIFAAALPMVSGQKKKPRTFLIASTYRASLLSSLALGMLSWPPLEVLCQKYCS